MRHVVWICIAASGCLSSGATPTAKVGTAITAKIGEVVQLDGSGSIDKNKQGLTYDWRFISSPSGSAPALSDPHVQSPTFAPDLEGAYVIGLVVADGALKSAQVTQTITVSGSCFAIPSAITTNQGEKAIVVTIDAQPPCDKAAAEFQWELLSRADGSTAQVQASAPDPDFVPDVPGNYTLQYSVRYGAGDWSAPRSIAVTVTNCAPTAVLTADAYVGSVDRSTNFSRDLSTAQCGHTLVTGTFRVVSDGVSNNFNLFPAGEDRDTIISSSGAIGNDRGADLVTVGLTVTDSTGLVSAEAQTPLIFSPAVVNGITFDSVSLQMDAKDIPSVAFYDSTRQIIVYAALDPTTGNWQTELAVTTLVTAEAYPVLFVSGGKPRIAYIDDAMHLQLITRGSTGAWTPLGAPLDTVVAGRISEVNSSTGNPRLLYTASATDLHLIACTNADCSSTQTAHPITPSNAATSISARLALSPTDLPRIGYLTAASATLGSVACTAADCSTTPTPTASVVDSTFAVQSDFAFATDPAGDPRFVYIDPTLGNVWYATCAGAACTAATWAAANKQIIGPLQKPYAPSLAFTAAGDARAVWTDNNSYQLQYGQLPLGGTWAVQPITNFNIQAQPLLTGGAAMQLSPNGNPRNVLVNSNQQDVDFIELGYN